MKVYLTDNIKLIKFDLQTSSDDFFTYNYTITNTNISCLITFEKKENVWYVKSNGTVDVYSNNTCLNAAEIKEYSNYKLKVLGYSGFINMFFSSFEEEKLYNLDCKPLQKIVIGSDSKCNICYSNPSVAPMHIVLQRNEKGWILSSIEDKNYYTFVNNYRVINKQIKAGDIIFLNGLKLIWMQNFFLINNPENKVRVVGIKANTNLVATDNTKYDTVSEEDLSYKLYSEDDYFYHTPRIREIVEDDTINIAPPPQSKKNEKSPWYLRFGPTILMCGSSFYMIINVINTISSGNAKVIQIIPQIIMLLGMVIAMFISPKIVEKYKKKQVDEYMRKRESMYLSYLEEKEKLIDLNSKRIVQILNDNNLSSTACKSVVTSPTNRSFWSREIKSDDFLTVRLGTGVIDNPIEIEAPVVGFDMEPDDLVIRASQLGLKYNKLDNVPVTTSLLENDVSAFIVNAPNFSKYDYFNNIMIQLVTLHSGSDLKIVILTDEDNADKWEYAKFLPHCWNSDRSFRYFATTPEEVKTVSLELENIYKKRLAILSGKEKLTDSNDEEKSIDNKSIYSNFNSYYLIICDNYKNTDKNPIIDRILSANQNIGFSVTILTDSLKRLPSQCDTFIQIGAKDGCILARDISYKNQSGFHVEYDGTLDMREVSNYLINVPLLPEEGLSVLPSSISFLDVYGVSKIEQLNILNRWKTNNPVLSLATPIGVYANGETFKLDLHEKYHGPHGLIAGTTGSGKSEFIISFILSMCVNYHPYEVQFVLIDYKGGGLAGAFENRELGTSIPHLAGTITNLDTASMNRTLVSIQSELKRRQQIFNEARDKLGESTIDIYKYQGFYHDGKLSEPLPHLFIISDEFAELKSQQPEFMNELISTARIGRSLGVHLILATQKPSGVVNEQIWSNSKFKICLKVQDKSDSMEVLKKPDAASIREPGRFYLQVGNDDFFDKGQSGWAGAKYIPSDRIIKKIDDSISFVNNTGEVVKSIKDLIKNDNVQDQGEQLTNLVKYIIDLGKKENVVTNKLWLDPIPETIFVSNLKEKYGYTAEPYVINPVIGEFDSPSTQTQGLLTYNINTNGNLLIAGKTGSGKENLITTIILSSIIDHTPDEINFYIIDCGTESLRTFNKMPHVGEIMFQDDTEKVNELFSMIHDEIEKRKDLMADYAGDYNTYIKESGEKLPLISVIINNYDVFLESYGRLSETLNPIYRDGPRYGITFIVSEIAANTIKGKVLQNFNSKLVLQLQDISAYRGNFGAPRNLFPSEYFGRGISFLENGIYEFQTAYLVEKSEINKFIREASKTYNEAYTTRAKKIPVVPPIVYDLDMYSELKDLAHVPVGYDIYTKEITTYDFNINQFTQIITNDVTPQRMSFLKALGKMLGKLDNVKTTIIDFSETITEKFENVDVYASDFDNAIVKTYNDVVQNKDSNDIRVIYILGIGMYKSFLNEQSVQVLNKLLTEAKQYPNLRVIIMDVMISFRNSLVENWYQTNVNNLSGIWLDYDVSQQIVINAPNVSFEERKYEFNEIAFNVINGKHIIMQHMVEKEEGDESNGQ